MSDTTPVAVRDLAAWRREHGDVIVGAYVLPPDDRIHTHTLHLGPGTWKDTISIGWLPIPGIADDDPIRVDDPRPGWEPDDIANVRTDIEPCTRCKVPTWTIADGEREHVSARHSSMYPRDRHPVDTARGRGRPAIGDRLTIRIDADTRTRLDQIATDRGVKVAEVARDIIAAGLAQMPSSGGPASLPDDSTR